MERPAPAVDTAGAAAAAEHTIADLLGEYAALVEPSADRVAQDAEAMQQEARRLQAACERLLNITVGGGAAAGAGAGQQGALAHRYRVIELRDEVATAMEAMSRATKRLVATAFAHAANLDQVMGNAVLHHLAQGRQGAPFIVQQPLEAVDIGFNLDNPALPASRYPAPFVELRRVDYF